MVDEIYGYFHSDNLMITSRGDYDDWHHKTCKTFLDLFKRAGGKDIKYGKAQKIINMSMKYLYCFNDSNKYSEKFIFCHMPLDHYTLEWFIHVVIPWTVKTNDERVEITKIRDTSWGNLNYSKNKDIYSYSWMQERIFGYLQSIENEKYLNENNEPLTPLEAEFYIWPEQKFMERIKEAIDLDLYDINYPKYKDDDLFDLCNSLSTKLLQLQEKIK